MVLPGRRFATRLYILYRLYRGENIVFLRFLNENDLLFVGQLLYHVLAFQRIAS